MASSSSAHHSWARPVAVDIRNLVAEDKAKFESTRRLDPCVLHVPTYIRKLKPDLFDASYVPMGLLYNKEFQGMCSVYKIKLEVLGCFLELLQLEEDEWNTFCTEVATQPSDSNTPDLAYFYEHDCYLTISSLTLESIQSILVTDAFFIVGLFLWRQEEQSLEGEQSQTLAALAERPRFIKRLAQIFDSGSLSMSDLALDRDIFWLYEDQIPLFLVRNAWEKVASKAGTGSFHEALKRKLCHTLKCSGLPFNLERFKEESNFDMSDHLLACVHKTLCENSIEKEEDGSSQQDKEKSKFAENVATFMNNALLRHQHVKRSTLPSAVQLAKSGIQFKCHRGLPGRVRFVKSFFRLSATLYLAPIAVADLIETMLLNMCLYESLNKKDDGVHHYVMLMDELIDTEDDVDLLMDGKDPIIRENNLGDNKLVVGIFTNPSQNLFFQGGDFAERFSKIRGEMIAWHTHPWRRRMVRFLDSYKMEPWLLVSLVAAIVLLVLTVVQTVYTIWGFYK